MTPLADPAAFGLLVLVALVVSLAVALVALLTVASRWVDAQKDLADMGDLVEELETKILELDAENARLHADAEWFRIVQHDDAPRLRVVPTQRDGEHDDLTALMRATEEER